MVRIHAVRSFVVETDHLIVNGEAVEPPFGPTEEMTEHMEDATVHFTQAAIDHTAILNRGTQTHAQIDTHVGDATVHFTQAAIDHTAILNKGTSTHAQIDTHVGDATIHFTQALINHTAILNKGYFTHAQIDSHLNSAIVHFTQGAIDHGVILNRGTNSHAQIDSHISANGGHAWVTQNVSPGGSPTFQQIYLALTWTVIPLEVRAWDAYTAFETINGTIQRGWRLTYNPTPNWHNLAATVTLPLWYKQGTVIKPWIHGCGSTDEPGMNCRLFLEYTVTTSIATTITGAYTSLTADIGNPGVVAPYTYMLLSGMTVGDPEIPGTNVLPRALLSIRIRRKPDAGDTYTGDVYLTGIGLNIQRSQV